VTPHPFWLVALVGGCAEVAEYARGYSDTHRKWLRRLLDGDGDGFSGSGGGVGGVGGGNGGGGGDGFCDGGGCGDGDSCFGSGGGGDGFGDGGSCFGSGGGGDGDGGGYAAPLRVRVGGEWWDRDRALAWMRANVEGAK
jgi:hypothetical protein